MESLPHDVVELILERLAVKPLMRFKCVSRQWKSTIESEYFKQRLLKQDPSALLQVVVVPTHEIDTRERVDEARRCTKQENIMIFVFLLIWSLVPYWSISRPVINQPNRTGGLELNQAQPYLRFLSSIFCQPERNQFDSYKHPIQGVVVVMMHKHNVVHN
ncbi:hypothetical protein YC2023_069946 [Brassica napus]